MFQIAKQIRSTKTPDGAIILDIQQNRLLTLNLIGATVLELVCAGHDETQIVGEIVRVSQTPVEIVSEDVKTFLHQLVELGIIDRFPSIPEMALRTNE